MREREISLIQISHVLGSGLIAEGPVKSINGNWECAAQGFSSGENSTHRYTERGLNNIYLQNGFHARRTPYGNAVSIENVEGLRRAMAPI